MNESSRFFDEMTAGNTTPRAPYGRYGDWFGGEDLKDLLRDPAVLVYIGMQVHGVRATPVRFGNRHCRVDPESSRFIRGGSYYPSMTGQGADHHGTPLVPGVLPLFAACKKRIQVHVCDPAVCLLCSCHVTSGALPAYLSR